MGLNNLKFDGIIAWSKIILEVVSLEKRTKREIFDFLLSNNFKATITMLLSAIAIARFVVFPNYPREICMYAVLISTFADLTLMDYGGIPKLIFKKANFGVGAFLFGIVQILYHVCFLKIMGIDALITLNHAGYIALSLGVLIIPSLLFIMSEKSHIYIIGVMIYSVCILLSMMTIFNCAYMFGNKYIFAAIGIVFFMISDIFILIRECLKDSTFVRKLIWIFYPIGQLMIIISI